MDICAQLRKLMEERGWTEYRLARESGLSQSTLANIFNRHALPSIPTLEAICNAFHISLSQFFAQDDMVELTPELKELLDAWMFLTPELKSSTLHMLRAINRSIEE